MVKLHMKYILGIMLDSQSPRIKLCFLISWELQESTKKNIQTKTFIFWDKANQDCSFRKNQQMDKLKN